ALLLIYKLAPNEKVSFRHAITGALFATIFWQLTSLAFSFYVNTLGNYSATYGGLGTVIVLMIWIYLFGIIITTGGVINEFVKDWEEGQIVFLFFGYSEKVARAESYTISAHGISSLFADGCLASSCLLVFRGLT